MENIIILILGIVLLIIGIINMTGNISTVHSYNRKRIKEEDVPKYGRLIGLGTVIIGIGIIVNFILTTVNRANLAPFVLIPAIAIGIILILIAQFKYNKGIF